MDIDLKIRKKLLAAAVAVALAFAGMTLELPWLTVAALGVWIAAMLVFGTGSRRVSAPESRNDST